MPNYLYKLLVGIDMLGNVVTGGNLDETISARSQRAAQRGDLWGEFMVKWLDWLQKNHGVLAEQGDLKRAETVESIEEKALTPPSSKP